MMAAFGFILAIGIYLMGRASGYISGYEAGIRSAHHTLNEFLLQLPGDERVQIKQRMREHTAKRLLNLIEKGYQDND